jgi:hypothetical protein
MRRTHLLATLAVTAICVGVCATPASADPPDVGNYGHCVTAGLSDPSGSDPVGGILGPANNVAILNSPSDEGGNAFFVFLTSGGHSRFVFGSFCPKQP